MVMLLHDSGTAQAYGQLPAVQAIVPFKTRDLSHFRRPLPAPMPESLVAAIPPSNDRGIFAPFTTRTAQSRRFLRTGWMAGLASFQQAAPAVPVAAWLAPRVTRRASAPRKLLVAPVLQWNYIAPPPIAWSNPPKVFRIEFRTRLQRHAAQLSFPPATGPPNLYPAWAARVLPPFAFEDRRLLRVEHDVYPETPKPEPNLCARIQLGFRKRRDAAWRFLRVELASYPATPAPSASNDRSLVEPFVTRYSRSRRLLRPPSLIVAGVATPGTSQAPLPAFEAKKPFYRPSKRKLLRLPELDRYPATQAPPAQPISALTPHRPKRRRTPTGLFLSSGPVVEARVQAQYPSFKQTELLKWRDRPRTLLRVAHPPAFPQTPAVPAQPVSAWRLPKQFTVEHVRKLLSAGPQPSFPATPPVPPQPESAWRLQVAFRWEHRRKLLAAAAQITYPPTPVPVVPYVATVLVRALFRRDTARTLLTVLHLPRYPQTPVPFQPPTAWKLAKVFRRYGWRQLRRVLELNWFERTVHTGYLVGIVRVQTALNGTPQVHVAMDGEPSTSAALDATVQVRPEE
jgi:hypothetical protein